MTAYRVRFIVRRDAASAWASANPVLLAGEMGIETGGSAPLLKIGDGTSDWNTLPYWNGGGVRSFNARVGAVTLSYSDVTGALGYTPTTVSGAVSAVAAVGTGLLKSSGSALVVVAAPSGAIVGTSDAQTLSNKRVAQRTWSAASATSLTPDLASADCYEITALAAGLTVGTPTGAPANFDQVHLRITDNGTARALSWSTDYAAMSSALPTTTVAGKTMRMAFEYSGAAAKWQLIWIAVQP